MFQSIIAKHVRRDPWSVLGFHRSWGRALSSGWPHFVCNELHFEWIWWQTLIIGADEPRDSERVGETPDVDLFESFVDKNANMNCRREISFGGHDVSLTKRRRNRVDQK